MSTVTFELRPYQIPMVEAALAAIRRGESEVLIAACPGAGKTEMAFEIVRRLVDAGEIDRALMLTWLRTQLKAQTLKRLKERAPGLLDHLRVEIPQQRRSIVGKYDLVIQDEAHQAYSVKGGMVEEVRNKVEARVTLLLTGSPSTFIKRGLKPASVFALEELHAAGRASDLMVEVGTSAYNIFEKDFDRDGDLKPAASARGTQRETDVTLDDLLEGLFNRIRLGRHSMGWWNRLMLSAAEKGWNPILKAMRKTIIACREIKQAEQVANYFRARNIETLISHSKLDEDSSNVDKFDTSSAPLLIVVDRAQLGYDNPALVNFIDMTGSRNPDRVFQMLCRVVRQSDSAPKKLFVKVMPGAFADQQLLYFMEGVLNLARREIFETYDGSGFYMQSVPTRKKRAESDENKEQTERKKPTTKAVLEPGMSLFGPSGYFAEISHTNREGYEAIGQIRLADAVGITVRETDEEKWARYFALWDKLGAQPSMYSKDPEEKKIAAWVRANDGAEADAA